MQRRESGQNTARAVAGGHQALFLTSHHEVGGGLNVAGKESGRGITVGDGSWIGARATIMPGVTIGERCIVGAGAVVTHDCAPGGVYVRVPARRIEDVAPMEPVEQRQPAQPAAV